MRLCSMACTCKCQFSALLLCNMRAEVLAIMQVDEEQLSVEEIKERKIMKLLLKVKNGTPPQRKSALRQLTDKARDFGAGPLFNQILPLLMSPTLEDQERHLLVKVCIPAMLCDHPHGAAKFLSQAGQLYLGDSHSGHEGMIR